MAYTLPTMLRQEGASLKVITLISFLAIPWALKLLWSRPLDQSPNRTPWFFCTLTLAALIWLILSSQDLGVWLNDHLIAFALLLVTVNFVMASQDVLTDGLVVRLLDEKEHGFGNSFQVIAYKSGMLISGGLFLWMYQWLGWQQGMWLVAGILLLAYLPFIFLHKKPQIQQALRSEPKVATEQNTGSNLISIVRDFARSSEIKYWLAILACYKLGDGMISGLTKPFWVDLGVSRETIGSASSIGIILGIAAGLAAGYAWRVLKDRGMNSGGILLFFALLQCSAILSYVYLSMTPFNATVWWALALYEQAIDVASTVVIFASMMSYCRKQFAGIDYTFQATVFLIASQGVHPVSGFIADAIGYKHTFMLAALLTIPVIFMLFRLRGGADSSQA